MIPLVIGVGVLIVALIVVFGILHSRAQNRAVDPTYELRMLWLANQPVLTTSSMDKYAAKRQWEIFQERFAVGTPIDDVSVADPASKDVSGDHLRTLRVSRLRREPMPGFPQSKIRFNAYFEPFEYADLPVVFQLSGGKHRSVELTPEGVTIRDKNGAVTWESSWSDCHFVGTESQLQFTHPLAALDRSRMAEHELCEALAYKYSGHIGHHL